jgi:hypothetical protein
MLLNLLIQGTHFGRSLISLHGTRILSRECTGQTCDSGKHPLVGTKLPVQVDRAGTPSNQARTNKERTALEARESKHGKSVSCIGCSHVRRANRHCFSGTGSPMLVRQLDTAITN